MPRSDTRIFQQLARAWTLRRRPVSRRSCATTATCDRARRCICRRSRSSSTTTTCRVASASTRRATPAKRSSSSIIGTAARAERRRCLERPKHRPHPLLRRLPPLLLHRRRLLLQCRYRCRYRCRRPPGAAPPHAPPPPPPPPPAAPAIDQQAARQIAGAKPQPNTPEGAAIVCCFTLSIASAGCNSVFIEPNFF